MTQTTDILGFGTDTSYNDMVVLSIHCISFRIFDFFLKERKTNKSTLIFSLLLKQHKKTNPEKQDSSSLNHNQMKKRSVEINFL